MHFAQPQTFTAPTPRAAPEARPAPPPVAVAPVAPSTPVRVADPAAVATWREVLVRVRARRPALASVLEHAALLTFGDVRIELGYETGSFLVGQATEPGARELLHAEVHAHFGKAVEVVFSTVSRGHGAPTIAQLEGAERKERHDAARKAVEDHPLVAAAIQLLGAELKDVRLADAAE
jgi:DNA polymerase-3 subunit gamma/tau